MGLIVAKTVFVAAAFLAFFMVYKIALEYFKRDPEK